MEEKRLLTLYVTEKQYHEIIEKYGKSILADKTKIDGYPVDNINKRSPIGLELRK